MSRRARSASMRAYSALRMAASASARFCSTASRLRLNSSSGSSPIAGGAGLDIGELPQDWCGQVRPDHIQDLVDRDLCGDGVHRWGSSLGVFLGLRGGWCRRVVPRPYAVPRVLPWFSRAWRKRTDLRETPPTPGAPPGIRTWNLPIRTRPLFH